MTALGQQPSPALVLASASATRAEMLQRAGIAVTIDPARVDEDALKAALRAEGATVEAAAEALAEAKSRQVGRRHPDKLVIGADQMLICNGEWFDKPPDLRRAAAHLRALSGQPHRLVSSAVISQGGQRIWHATRSAVLTVRPLSDDFIAAYIAAAGSTILSSVGAYQLEGLGAQLFSGIEGDHFTILGMPLFPLLDFLRQRGVLLG